MTSQNTVASLAQFVDGVVVDPSHGDRPIEGVADVQHAGPAHIGFIRDAKYAKMANSTEAGALLVCEEFETSAAQIMVDDPYTAFARIALYFHPMPIAKKHSIHPTAVVDESAELVSPVEVGPNVVIEAGARIGAGTSIQAGAVIGAGVVIGSNCTLFPRVVIYSGVTMGDRVILHAGVVLGSDGFGYVPDKQGVRHKFPQVGTLLLGDDVEIGANSTVDRGALTQSSIGKGTKIDNLCHIGHNVIIGKDCAICAFSGFAGGTVLGDRVLMAGLVMCTGYLTICDDVAVGGNSVITSDVKEPGEYSGYPLLPRWHAAKAAVMHTRLPTIADQVKQLWAKVMVEDSSDKPD